MICSEYSEILRLFSKVLFAPSPKFDYILKCASACPSSFLVPSGPPLDVRCRGISPDAVSVEWSKPRREERNGIIRGYSVRYYPRALCYGKCVYV